VRSAQPAATEGDRRLATPGFPNGRSSAAVSEPSMPDQHLGKAVSSDDRNGLTSHARYAGTRAHEPPLRR